MQKWGARRRIPACVNSPRSGRRPLRADAKSGARGGSPSGGRRTSRPRGRLTVPVSTRCGTRRGFALKRTEVSLGRAIRGARTACGLSIGEVARRMTRSAAWLTRIERGTERLRMDDLPLLARILKTTCAEIFARTLEIMRRSGG